jgi:peptidoglycan/xylan/chitin deacetylase (PgdA/CDA1 family)
MSHDLYHSSDITGSGDPRHIRVLLYHSIHQDDGMKDVAGIRVFDTTFRKQMEMLDRWGYTTITFDDYRLFLEGKIDLPKQPIILTFDDAYEDFYTEAFPILKEFGMKAVIFVVGDSTINSNIWDVEYGDNFKLLSVQQILELHMADFEIGSHTFTHPNLVSITKEKAWEEIVRSRMQLEILLNSPVKSFSYPYGKVDEAIKLMIVKAGYNIGCAAYSGPPLFGADHLEIRRTKVLNTANKFLFRMQLFPIYSYYRWILWAIKKRRGLEKNQSNEVTSSSPPKIMMINKHTIF